MTPPASPHGAPAPIVLAAHGDRGSGRLCGATLRVLGGFELTCADEPVAMPSSAQRVLAFLALSERPVHRARVAGTLWTEASESRAASALRTALWRIGRHGMAALHCDGATLALHPQVEVDLTRVTHTARAIVDGASPGGGELQAIRDAGDVLPGWYDDWVLVASERFRQLRLHALERLCHALSTAGRHADATQAGLAAVAADPLRESAHRALVSAHLAYGNAGDALRQYALCRDLLERELGIAPSSALESLIGAMRRTG